MSKNGKLKNYDEVHVAMVAVINRTEFGIPLSVFTAAVGDALREKLMVTARFYLEESDAEILPLKKGKENKYG